MAFSSKYSLYSGFSGINEVLSSSATLESLRYVLLPVPVRTSEKPREFKNRFADILSSIRNGSYLEKNNITIYELGLEIIENKLKRNKVGESTYSRDKQTLQHLKDCN